ncbi:unnamed protein product [Euphydryas editha]|uniref:Nucleoside diphosphate kinase-like domain-containing protein n=1 Tax=Euphydryas editha TaxID=104508 RepID=A0AAU9USK6_EUPED|nr:unnamed protein product [Euphydryas editha]
MNYANQLSIIENISAHSYKNGLFFQILPKKNHSPLNTTNYHLKAMSIHLAEGKCVALEVKCNNPNINCVCEFRQLCGPRDPELSRQLYPDSIRALYGKNIVHNAVHCTDLVEDGQLEVEYFFKLLAND